jgi:hypothetical protein
MLARSPQGDKRKSGWKSEKWEVSQVDSVQSQTKYDKKEGCHY